MSAWEKLTLYDRLIETIRRNGKIRKLGTSSFEDLKQAVKFTVTERASDRIGAAFFSYPEQISKNLPFARPPFPSTWIEYPLVYFGQLTEDEVAENAVLTVGYHFVEFTTPGRFIVSVYGENRARNPDMAFQSYIVDASGNTNGEVGIFTFPEAIDVRLSAADKQILRSHILTRTPTAFADSAYEGIPEMVKGDILYALALLLAVNQPPTVVTLRDIPRRRSLVKGKPLTYFGHTEVDLVLGKKVSLRSLLSAPRGWRGMKKEMRWHRVVSHWFHKGGRKQCSHEWVELHDADHFACVHCNRKRTRRYYPDGHGTAQKGYIHQTRTIRTPEDKKTTPVSA